MGGARLGGLVVAAGSAALLGGALGFQYLGGLYPCELCMWQRWAHVAALAAGLLALIFRGGLARAGFALAVLALLAGAGIAVFHAGVEQQWWQGLTACGGATATGSAADLLQAVETAPIVRCGDIAWSLFGLSMAAWNALMSAGLAALALAAARRR
ncbi:disulfide bond formation protein B [Zavarzinia aquatilis]|uniref:Disulfide bond formation protein B n=1 Tax=Zavarzinia aquatilis TaxID=2211142 RepID=A0A317E4F5_9PROT|nr:disulfide bond formation protein B [Zavarzinia aquatilis]